MKYIVGIFTIAAAIILTVAAINWMLTSTRSDVLDALHERDEARKLVVDMQVKLLAQEQEHEQEHERTLASFRTMDDALRTYKNALNQKIDAERN